MSIESFVKTLLPSIDRSTVLEDAATTIEELRECTIPPYMATVEAKMFLGDYQFQSDWMAKRDKEYRTRFRNSSAGMVNTIAATLAVVLKRVEFSQSLLEKEMTHDLARDGITYPKATAVQILELGSFYSRYARRFLLMCYACEIPEFNSEISKERPFSNIEVKQLEEQFQSFLSVTEVFSRSDKDFSSAITSIPDMLVDLHDEAISHAVAGTGNLNPMALGFISHVWNPVYHIRMAIANWQDTRCKAAEEERKALEYRLVQLRMAMNGENNAAIEKQIAYTERRVMNLNLQIAKLEKVK